MRYPAECPVFEALKPYLDVCPGDVVEAFTLFDERYPKEDHLIQVRVVCPAAGQKDLWSEGEGLTMEPVNLRPLTRAARDMLALVRR